jgi:hypothetical protein
MCRRLGLVFERAAGFHPSPRNTPLAAFYHLLSVKPAKHRNLLLPTASLAKTSSKTPHKMEVSV